MFSSSKHHNLVWLLIIFCCAAAERKCKTPSGQTGVCTRDIDCPVYKKAYDESFIKNVEYFRWLQCDYEGHYPTVCCITSGDYNIVKIVHPSDKRYRNTTKRFEISNRFGDDKLPNSNICGKQVHDNRIINGEVTEIDEFPWMALLIYKKCKPLLIT